MKPAPEPGTRLGRWTVLHEERIAPTPAVPYGRRAVRCRCDCGNEGLVALLNLHDSRSCGCLHREIVAEHNRRHKSAQNTDHGLSRHPLYQTWAAMVKRCTNPNARMWPNYGGRGIKVCDEWRDVEVFLAYIEANLGPRPHDHSLDRINNDGHYEPGNVRWATRSQQSKNRRPFKRRAAA